MFPSEISSNMEREGVRIDVKKIEISINRLMEDADALKKLIFQEAGCEFDLDSPEGDFGRPEQG